ncbi:hypothetical protein ACTPOE_11630 [Castellaniella sp. WN]
MLPISWSAAAADDLGHIIDYIAEFEAAHIEVMAILHARQEYP